MGVSDDEDTWNSESVGNDGDGPRCEDKVEEVIQLTSVTDDNSVWLSPEGIKSVSAFMKIKPEVIVTVSKHKEILPKEVVKNGSVVDQ